MPRFLVIVLLLLTIPVLGQENSPTPVPTMPNLIGLTAPEAHALLAEHGLLLDPVFSSSTTSTGENNTIIDQSLAAGEAYITGAVISVTLHHSNNIELIWQTENFGTDAFTIVNLSDAIINFDNVDFLSADATKRLNLPEMPNILRERNCFQLWVFQENNGTRLPECNFLQGGGILTVENPNRQFWLGVGSFYVLQEGLRRAECEIALGRCQLWVSPTPIAEEFSPYVFLMYNQHELIIHNRAENQWMPLNQIAFNQGLALNDAREWDTVNFSPELPFLAPNQCVRYSDGRNQALAKCTEVAYRQTGDIFWASAFTVRSLRSGDTAKTCPAANGDELTLCLLLR